MLAAGRARPASPAPRRPAAATPPPGTIAYTAVGHRRRAAHRHVRRRRRRAPAGCGWRAPTRDHDDRPARRTTSARWTSPWASPGFALTELVPSWAATHPRGHAGPGRRPRRQRGRHPQQLGHARPLGARRRARSGAPAWARQTDDLGRVTPTPGSPTYGRLHAPGSCGSRCCAQGRHHARPRGRHGRRGGLASCPHVDRVTTSTPGVGARASCSTCRATPRWCTAASTRSTAAAARPGARRPRRRWCSATTARLPARRRRTPGSSASYRDRVVDHAARMTYDYGYDGTGNWPFNTAYAARCTGARVRDPAARRCARPSSSSRAGIPVVASITFGARRSSTGAPISRHQRPPAS